MALDNTRWGNAVAAAVQGVGITDDAKITTGQLEVVWRAICGEHQGEIDTNADINLDAADVSTDVPGLGLLDGMSNPVTGQATGTNQAVILAGKIE
jgi:hypothetical protein